ncbi:hypothetical protein P152DRAFT_474688 [Eremomyces bilateralis CBS 781.70]|uniref:Uncharacterized protein n=1 Tax=Eremomyces bilateralis CBS 781.70 TaxID=1392243 RepID=A0A6G1G0S8_9PEZI|nr:uncharacterized protein P152DRAFT_474688 [Eremomyces bilateralis CBS 781.70]KAF1811530.1 hypothetical protein P152DRAFT_474688 [Eremomyces bilateralis CBS 781.70]
MFPGIYGYPGPSGSAPLGALTATPLDGYSYVNESAASSGVTEGFASVNELPTLGESADIDWLAGADTRLGSGDLTALNKIAESGIGIGRPKAARDVLGCNTWILAA